MSQQISTTAMTTAIMILSMLAACKGTAASDSIYVDPGADDPEPVSGAIAVLHPTEGHETRAVVRFTKSGDGLDVETEAEGLSPGTHAYHVHLYGDCSGPAGKSAGTHFNFKGPSEDPPEDIARITGNLGELTADASGRAQAENHVEDAELGGRYSILGRSVIIHASGNDPDSPPIGAAGARVACGVIGIPD